MFLTWDKISEANKEEQLNCVTSVIHIIAENYIPFKARVKKAIKKREKSKLISTRYKYK